MSVETIRALAQKVVQMCSLARFVNCAEKNFVLLVVYNCPRYMCLKTADGICTHTSLDLILTGKHLSKINEQKCCHKQQGAAVLARLLTTEFSERAASKTAEHRQNCD